MTYGIYTVCTRLHTDCLDTLHAAGEWLTSGDFRQESIGSAWSGLRENGKSTTLIVRSMDLAEYWAERRTEQRGALSKGEKRTIEKSRELLNLRPFGAAQTSSIVPRLSSSIHQEGETP